MAMTPFVSFCLSRERHHRVCASPRHPRRADLAVGAIASASGGNVGTAALYTLYAGLAVAVLGTIIGALTAIGNK